MTQNKHGKFILYDKDDYTAPYDGALLRESLVEILILDTDNNVVSKPEITLGVFDKIRLCVGEVKESTMIKKHIHKL